jgi:hypothetical protein
LAFAATAIHGRGAKQDADTVHAVGFNRCKAGYKQGGLFERFSFLL